MRDISIRQETGKNLRSIISQELVTSPIVVVKELVSNSYDADAEKVTVNSDIENKTLIVEDDGYGMGESDLENFVRMGDSEKLENPLTKKGRNCIGQFGIATVLIEYLGSSYTIDTWDGRTNIKGSERFSDDAGLEYTVNDICAEDRGKRGTKLTINEVTSLGTSVFSVSNLKKALTWEVPSSEDLPEGDSFKVILDGEELIRQNAKPLEEFDFESNLEGIGPVNMHLELYKTHPPINGVYVYVHNRSVGDPNDFKAARVSRNFRGRIFAKVHADGLSQYISFNRDRFREDDSAFSTLKKWIYTNIRTIRSSLESLERKTAQVKVPTSAGLIDVLNQTKLVSLESDNNNRDSRKSSDNNGESASEQQNRPGTLKPGKRISTAKGKDYSDLVQISGLHTIKEGLSGPQATFVPKTRELVFNVSHPWYRSVEISTPELMNMHILLGTSFGLAEGFYLESGGSQEYVNEFNRLSGELLSQRSVLESVRLRSSQTSDTGRFVPAKRYSAFEIRERAQISLQVLRRLVESGILSSTDNKVKGSQLNDYIRLSANHTPAYAVMVELGGEKGFSRERKRQMGDEIDDILSYYQDILPFLYNIGQNDPFFLVPNEYVSTVKGLYVQKAIKGGQLLIKPARLEAHLATHKELFEQACGASNTKQYLGLEEICDFTRDSPSEVFKIISYAQRKGIVLPFKSDSSRVFYEISSYKKAREKYIIREKE